MFPEVFHQPIVAQFDQREGSSDGVALLLKAADPGLGLLDDLTACLQDGRQAGKVDHSLRELLAQRVFSIACGYPDANDSTRWLAIPFTSSCWIGIRSKARIWPRNRRCRVSKTG